VPEREANLAAAFKVARRAKLSDVVVTAVTAKRHGDLNGKIEPLLTDQYEVVEREETRLKILCRHSLEAASADRPVAEIHVDLNLIYDLNAGEPIDDSDLLAFANANGAYNSWPFIREVFNSLTLRLGLPGFILPSLLLVNPKPPAPPVPAAPAETPKE
jgi:hypothetical protein